MSTNSIIAYKREDGSVEGVYCHWNGYLEGVGQILLDHYDFEKTCKLVDLGSLSSLGEEIEAPEGTPHSYDEPYPGVTVAYNRDRGERRKPNFTAPNMETFLHKVPCVEYTYILADGAWKVYLSNSHHGHSLKDILD